MKNPVYTHEMVNILHIMYANLGNDGLSQIAYKLGKSIRSVRYRLIKDGIYIPIGAPKYEKKFGPSKRDLLKALSYLGINVEGFEYATKESIERVTIHIMQISKIKVN